MNFLVKFKKPQSEKTPFYLEVPTELQKCMLTGLQKIIEKHMVSLLLMEYCSTMNHH